MAAYIPAMPMNSEPDLRIRVVAVLPDVRAAQPLLALLEGDVGFEVLEHCHDVISAGEAIRSSAPELAVADEETAEELRIALEAASVEPPAIAVFTPAADRAALELVLLRAKLEVQRRRLRDLNHRLHSRVPVAAPERLRRFAVRTDDRIVFFRPEEIDWIQAAGNYVRLHVGDASYPMRLTMSRMELLLAPDSFMRVHRNAIVNLDRVLEFQIPSTGNMFAVLRNGKRLPLSRGYRGDLRAFLCRSLGVSCRLSGPGAFAAEDDPCALERTRTDETSLQQSALLH